MTSVLSCVREERGRPLAEVLSLFSRCVTFSDNIVQHSLFFLLLWEIFASFVVNQLNFFSAENSFADTCCLLLQVPCLFINDEIYDIVDFCSFVA